MKRRKPVCVAKSGRTSNGMHSKSRSHRQQPAKRLLCTHVVHPSACAATPRHREAPRPLSASRHESPKDAWRAEAARSEVLPWDPRPRTCALGLRQKLLRRPR